MSDNERVERPPTPWRCGVCWGRKTTATDRALRRGAWIVAADYAVGIGGIVLLGFAVGNSPLLLLALVPQVAFALVAFRWSTRKHRRELEAEVGKAAKR